MRKNGKERIGQERRNGAKRAWIMNWRPWAKARGKEKDAGIAGTPRTFRENALGRERGKDSWIKGLAKEIGTRVPRGMAKPRGQEKEITRGSHMENLWPKGQLGIIILRGKVTKGFAIIAGR